MKAAQCLDMSYNIFCPIWAACTDIIIQAREGSNLTSSKDCWSWRQWRACRHAALGGGGAVPWSAPRTSHASTLFAKRLFCCSSRPKSSDWSPIKNSVFVRRVDSHWKVTATYTINLPGKLCDNNIDFSISLRYAHLDLALIHPPT
jgi:hypothetical protein